MKNDHKPSQINIYIINKYGWLHPEFYIIKFSIKIKNKLLRFLTNFAYIRLKRSFTLSGNVAFPFTFCFSSNNTSRPTGKRAHCYNSKLEKN